MLPLALALILGRDLEWERIQVEWIYETKTVKNTEQVIPREQAELLRLLDDNRYLVRELASNELIRQGMDASAALAWGAYVDKKLIIDTSAKLRSLLYICQHCLGDGFCPACNRPPVFEGKERRQRRWLDACPDECGWNGLCVACGGSGDIRYTLKWDGDLWAFEWLPGQSGKMPVERDLFSAEVDGLIKRGRGVPRKSDDIDDEL